MTRFATKLTLAFAILALTVTAARANTTPAKDVVQGRWTTLLSRGEGKVSHLFINLLPTGDVQLIVSDLETQKPLRVGKGTWSYENGVLAITIDDKKVSFRIERADKQVMIMVEDDGRKQEWHRD